MATNKYSEAGKSPM